ncbi:mixed lineage kinase domain-like protein isoform X2 [Sebastes umbrosus]|uniref:mixed lineage kinase domain-like protein isoform X2 n=1 Tax=Sebastes umbrosus TaxID=72105 RepID=UPI0018A03883|nr:mixed lineage kinase domain-like protein isoform X2 [Sebastes umbrosus]
MVSGRKEQRPVSISTSTHIHKTYLRPEAYTDIHQQPIMDVIDPILSIASEIYALVETVKANKKRSQRVCHRVKALDELLRSIKKREMGQTTADVKRALGELSLTLTSAKALIKKYTSATWVKRILKAGSHEDEFNSVNERLNDAFQVLSGALQVEQGNVLHQVFELTSREKEDDADRKEDNAELQTMLLQYMKEQQEKTDAVLKEMESVKSNVEKIVALLNKPSATDEAIRMIKPQELKYECPKKPFMTTSSSEVYKGEYRRFPVAIKRFIDPVNTSPSELRKVFNKEIETMRRFESPNILRMFGICVQDEDGPSPQYLIIMEYCEKGSLRQVLDSGCKLSWTTKASMCRDAARGLYRLHHTEAKSKVHGSINSSKFLVTTGNIVKLGGFELSKTETSLRKATKDKEIRSLCYSSPLMLLDINHIYSTQCEIYSFGIVLWEVATGSKPFEGWSNTEILQKVGKDKFQQPLPNDCPEELGRLINDCRHYDGFQRPFAGVLVDKLQSVVAKLEE